LWDIVLTDELQAHARACYGKEKPKEATFDVVIGSYKSHYRGCAYVGRVIVYPNTDSTTTGHGEWQQLLSTAQTSSIVDAYRTLLDALRHKLGNKSSTLQNVKVLYHLLTSPAGHDQSMELNLEGGETCNDILRPLSQY
jgi:hypothetical protein